MALSGEWFMVVWACLASQQPVAGLLDQTKSWPSMEQTGEQP
jgi:hypothetical protein